MDTGDNRHKKNLGDLRVREKLGAPPGRPPCMPSVVLERDPHDRQRREPLSRQVEEPREEMGETERAADLALALHRACRGEHKIADRGT